MSGVRLFLGLNVVEFNGVDCRSKVVPLLYQAVEYSFITTQPINNNAFYNWVRCLISCHPEIGAQHRLPVTHKLNPIHGQCPVTRRASRPRTHPLAGKLG